jgi:2-methylcitrate dehydratase PrpD
MKHFEARKEIKRLVDRINCKEGTRYEATYHEKQGWMLLLYKYDKDGNYIEHTFGDYGTTDFLTSSEMLWYLRGINKNI